MTIDAHFRVDFSQMWVDETAVSTRPFVLSTLRYRRGLGTMIEQVLKDNRPAY